MRMILTTLTLAGLAAAAGWAAADAKAGQAVYDRSCKSCHGADGAANPAIAKAMNMQMRDLKSAEVQSKSDADLKKVVTDGQGKMRPIPSVSGVALDNVIAYTRSLKK
jgi:mono/diheme cytochrome c family protein